MKRSLMVFLLVVFVFSSISVAQNRHRPRRARARARVAAAGPGKIAVPCPSPLNSIQDCPDTGCGPSLDPNLNKQKNIQTDNRPPVDKDLQDLADLPDPVPDFAIGDTREKVTALGEGAKIRVVAFALVARKGGKESCNCSLLTAPDTDNHIVLVDPSLAHPTLAADEPDSQTAEFTARV